MRNDLSTAQENSCKDTTSFAQEKGHFVLQAVKEITQKHGRVHHPILILLFLLGAIN